MPGDSPPRGKDRRHRRVFLHGLLLLSLCAPGHARGTEGAAGIEDRQVNRAIPHFSRLRSRPHALPHLALLRLPAGRAAGVLRVAEDQAVAAVADGGVLFLLRLVESLLPDPGGVFHFARLLPGGTDGPLPESRSEGGCDSAVDGPEIR